MIISLLASALLLTFCETVYVLEDDYYATDNFLDEFTLFTDADPTHGYVTYLDQEDAIHDGLIYANSAQFYMGVDYNNIATGSGRDSVRISSNKSYTHGLFILDLAHMPQGCGTWPAFWLLGPSWPNGGEIDIIEGVNDATNNAMTLHTSAGCNINNSGTFTGTLGTSNCYVNAPNQYANPGCGIQNPSNRSFGSGFNVAGGGVYATEWTSAEINIWFFPRGGYNMPEDIVAGSPPDPTTWGQPAAQFAGDCDIDGHFQNLQIVFDTTFCGDWAGSVWNQSEACSALAPSCVDYVRNNPGAFAEAFWTIDSLRVFHWDGGTDAAGGVSSQTETG